MNRRDQDSKRHSISKEDVRKIWLEAVEALAENIELKRRVEFLERQIATNTHGGWRLH